MTLLKFLNDLFLFHINTERIIEVRIIKRDKNDIIIEEKHITIQSIFNPLTGPMSINIDHEDVNNQPWVEI